MKKTLFIALLCCAFLISSQNMNAQCSNQSWGLNCSVQSNSFQNAWYQDNIYITPNVPVTITTHIVPDIYNHQGGGGFEVDCGGIMWFDYGEWGYEHYGGTTLSAAENSTGSLYLYLTATLAYSQLTVQW